MALTPTTDDDAPAFRELALESLSDSWAQAEIRSLGGADPFDVLRGGMLQPTVAIAAPHGRFGDLLGTGWAILYLVTPTFATGYATPD